ncbi:hypothetical protein J0H58_06615 [bacterium]|nr:hypothetical protein [bacterium]
MNTDVESYAPESAADRVTMLGMAPLLLTGLLRDSIASTPSIVSVKIFTKRKSMLTYMHCENISTIANLLAFLTPRQVYWHSLLDLWHWARAHHWPNPDDLRPGGLTLGDLPAQGEIGTKECTNDEEIRRVVTEQGRYDYDNCFALDQHIVAWDPAEGQFQFPVINDYAIHQSCVAKLGTQNAAFSLNRPWLDPDFSDFPRSFDPLRQFGRDRKVPMISHFLQRLSFWEATRNQLHPPLR